MSEPSSVIPRRAVIIGGSFAGMLAAAAVSDYVDTIAIIEAHELPTGPQPRTGVPQAAHFHTLLSSGAEAIEKLLPGSITRMVDAGANRVPVTTGVIMYAPEGWYRRWQHATHYQITASRDLIDSVIRQQVLKNTKVTVHQGKRVVGLLGDRRRVTGVRLYSRTGGETEMAAHLVIDASGRSTRTPHWLKDLGIADLCEARIDSGLCYASRIYQAPVPTRNWPIINIQADFRKGQPRAGGIIPIERDQWHVSLIGPPGAEPGRDASSFEQYAKTLRHPLVADLLTHARPLTDVTFTRTTANRRYFYERLHTWPDGLLVVGDAVAAFNPVYGQGMTVAACGALAIQRVFSVNGLADGVVRKTQRAIAGPVQSAWSLSVGTDIHRPTTRGKRPNAADRLLQRYISRLSHTATGSHLAATALTDVLMLHARPSSLVTPKMLVAALRGPARPKLDAPPLSLAERQVLSSASPASAIHWQ